MNRHKSVKQLDTANWKTPATFETGLVKRCYEYVNIPIKDLTIEQLRTLITQKIGVPFILDETIDRLSENILAEGDFYLGDLLEATVNLGNDLWTKYPNQKKQLASLIEQNRSEVEAALGRKITQKL